MSQWGTLSKPSAVLPARGDQDSLPSSAWLEMLLPNVYFPEDLPTTQRQTRCAGQGRDLPALPVSPQQPHFVLSALPPAAEQRFTGRPLT